MSSIEQTLSIIKPDAVERNLQEEIKNEFTKNGFFILKEKSIASCTSRNTKSFKFFFTFQIQPSSLSACCYNN